MSRSGVPEFLRSPVAEIVALLADRKYADLESDGRAGRLSAAELRRAVTQYGRTIVPLPEEAFDAGETTRITNARLAAWHIAQDLWTAEEGRSDLTLELLARFEDGLWRVEVDGLHVL